MGVMRAYLVSALAVAACGRLGFRPVASHAADAPGASDAAMTCALPAPWDVGATYDRVLYVSTSGSDSNDGSAGAPFATIAAAAAIATAGTKIDVAPGVYPAARLTGLAGEAARPIAISGEPGAIIDDQGAGDVGLAFAGASYIVVEGLAIRNAFHGVYFDESSTNGGAGFIARGLTVQTSADVGIKVYWADQVFIEDNTIDDSASEGIYVVGGRGGVIAGNTIRNAPFGIQVVSGSTDLLVQGNRVSGTTAAALLVGGPDTMFVRPPAVYQASGTQVVSNIVTGGGPAVEIDDAEATVVSHNTLIAPAGTLFSIVHENPTPTGGAQQGSFDANLISFQAATLSSFVKVAGTSQLDTFTLHQNLWWATDAPSFAGPTLPAPLVETGTIVGVDPMLTGDGHLAEGSPAIGRSDPAPGLIDIDGACTTGSGATTPGADQP